MKMKKNIFTIVTIGMMLLSGFLTSSAISSSTAVKGTIDVSRSKTMVFDNGMNYGGLYAAQWDENRSFDAYPADDFQFNADTQVNAVNWIGGYFGDNYSQGNFDWNVTFYYDRGNGSAPGSVYAGPYIYTPDQYNQTFLEENATGEYIYYNFSVDLPTTLTFTADEKYWISIWGVGAFPPQSGWSNHSTLITLHQAVFKSKYFFNTSDWYNTIDVFGTASDMCFQLLSTEQNFTTITINSESPANNSMVNISQSTVSVNIDAIHVIISGDVGAMAHIPFNWTIEGQYIEPAGANYDTAGIKTANLPIQLPYSTQIVWYVNVTAAGVKENKIFHFTTESPPNQPPVANYSYTIKDRNVSFDSSSSYDPDGTIEGYGWYFGDGNTSNVANPFHNFKDDGIYNVTLAVEDNDNATNSITKSINVINNPPVANITYTLTGGSKTVVFYGSHSYDINGTIVSYFWEFGDGKNSTDKNVSHTYEKDYRTYMVNLTVTDSAGSTNTTSRDVPLGDLTNPTIEIVKPAKKTIYINNQMKRQRLFGMPLIIGEINIVVNAKDVNGSGIAYAQLWIGKNMVDNQTSGMINYTWSKDRLRLFHVFTIKVVAFDNASPARNSATSNLVVRKYL